MRAKEEKPQEDLQARKERLVKQREVILKQKQQERSKEAKEFQEKQEKKTESQPKGISKEELERRKAIMDKIKLKL